MAMVAGPGWDCGAGLRLLPHCIMFHPPVPPLPPGCAANEGTNARSCIGAAPHAPKLGTGAGLVGAPRADGGRAWGAPVERPLKECDPSTVGPLTKPAARGTVDGSQGFWLW